MNRPIESQFTEILIERNAYRAFLEELVNDNYDRVSPGVKAKAAELLRFTVEPTIEELSYAKVDLSQPPPGPPNPPRPKVRREVA